MVDDVADVHRYVIADKLFGDECPDGLGAPDLPAVVVDIGVGSGEATVFLPTAVEIQRLGRVRPVTVPAAEFAVIVHAGSHADVDRAYGALATYVTSHALQVDGPIREYYLVGRHDTDDESAWRTEICWPIFSIGAARPGAGPHVCAP